jgi:hypothetical protein
MKKLFTTITFLMLALAASAQNYSTWHHHGNYQLNQSYDIIEMSDGNLAVREAVFDENLDDVGFNLYKITPQGELLDSLFIEDHNVYSLNPFLRDPYNSNSNIMTSFYTLDDVNYYKATYYDDNLNITDEVVTEYYDNCDIPRKFFIDSNNDLICRSKLDDDNFCLVRMGLDGTLKAQSNPIPKQSGTNIVLEHPIFELSPEPLRYGYVLYRDNDITIDIYDENFTKLDTKTVNRFEDWQFHTSIYTNACGTGDGGFFITAEAGKIQGQSIVHTCLLLKFNADFEIESGYSLGEFYSYPRWDFDNRNLLVTDNSIYLACKYKKTVEVGNGSKTSLVVKRFDKDLNLTWEEYTIEVVDSGEIVVYGLTALSNGGIATTGWLYSGSSGYYSSKDIYAIAFDNYLSADENSASENPFICYPNPAKDVVQIDFSESFDCQSIEIYAIDGRLLESQNNNLDKITIANLTPGLYLIKVRMNDGKEFSERIVKE